MDRLISEKQVLNAIADFIKNNDSVAKLILNINAIPSAEPCEDAISRQAVMDALCNDCELFKNGEQTCFSKCEEYHFLATLPSVKPQEKTGHWINIDATHSKCDRCGAVFEIASENGEVNYCPNCGVRMFEEQESEDKR